MTTNATFTVPALVNIRIGKTDRELPVDVSKFSPDVLAYIIHYGLKQRLNDVHASMSLDDDGADEINAQVNKALDALYSGDIRMAGERTTDQAMQIALDNAERTLALALGKRWKTVKNKRALAKDYVSRHPEVYEDAKVQLERIRDMAAELDLPTAAE